jgi:AcrR family transcriptional regulator
MSDPRPARKSAKRTNDPEGIRRRILDVAADSFQSRGYEATSIHDLVREAQTTGGALHHHFPTKKSLGLAVIRERVAPAVEEAWIEPVRSARSASQGILAAFRDIAAGLRERGRVRGCPLNNLTLELSLADPDYQQALQQIFSSWRGAIAERLKLDKAQGLTQLDPEAFSTLVVAGYSGAMAMAKAQQDAAPLEVCAKQLAAVMKAQGRGSPAKEKLRVQPGKRKPA